jgi:tRNA pseudouridine55 synthase
MQGFVGSIMQRPPAYSAVKRAGVPSYKLAREGKAEPLAPRSVSIYSIELTAYENPFVSFTVRCSKGVYVRTLCADIGDALGMGAHLTGLDRTRSGKFSLEQAHTLDQLAESVSAGALEQVIIPLDEAIDGFPCVPIGEAEATRILHGNQISCPASLANSDSGMVRIHDPAGRILALARIHAGFLKPELVFA